MTEQEYDFIRNMAKKSFGGLYETVKEDIEEFIKRFDQARQQYLDLLKIDVDKKSH